MARDPLDDLDRVQRRFADAHNDWAGELAAISPDSLDIRERIVAAWSKHNVAARWEDLSDVVRQIALETER